MDGISNRLESRVEKA